MFTPEPKYAPIVQTEPKQSDVMPRVFGRKITIDKEKEKPDDRGTT